MQDTLNTIRNEAEGAARYRWHGMVAAWIICVLGWAVVMALPNVYEAQARIFADTRTALTPVIEGLAIQQDVSAQLNLVQQSLLGESELSRVIDETDFATIAKSQADRAKIMDRLRKEVSVNIEISRDKVQRSGQVYSISYRDADRARSLKVVDVLLKAFVEETVGGKKQNSDVAQEFLRERIVESEKRLRDAEQRLADFKKINVGTMPGAEGDYFTRLQNEMDANRKARTALSVAMSRREELTRQLREGASMAAGTGVVPTVASDGRQVAAGDTVGRMMQARGQLADLLTQYTDKHPAVAALREEIANLEQRRARELEALRLGDPEAVLATGASANPVYQSIQLALNETGVQIAALRGEISQHEQKISELQRLVQTVPEVEAEFARLNRDYDVTKSQYQALVERLAKANLGKDAEATGSAVLLEVLNPPTAALNPVAPKRPLLVALVFLAGIAGGAALAWLLSKFNPVFNHSRELEEITKYPVLGVVSLSTLKEFHVAVRQSYLRFGAVAAGLVFTFLALLIVSQRIPNLLA
jgi:polysaccharide chain length determinant protein (PEP-CTERM system associated)